MAASSSISRLVLLRFFGLGSWPRSSSPAGGGEGGGERAHARESRTDIATLTGRQSDSSCLLMLFARERVVRLGGTGGDASVEADFLFARLEYATTIARAWVALGEGES